MGNIRPDMSWVVECAVECEVECEAAADGDAAGGATCVTYVPRSSTPTSREWKKPSVIQRMRPATTKACGQRALDAAEELLSREMDDALGADIVLALLDR